MAADSRSIPTEWWNWNWFVKLTFVPGWALFRNDVLEKPRCCCGDSEGSLAAGAGMRTISLLGSGSDSTTDEQRLRDDVDVHVAAVPEAEPLARAPSGLPAVQPPPLPRDSQQRRAAAGLDSAATARATRSLYPWERRQPQARYCRYKKRNDCYHYSSLNISVRSSASIALQMHRREFPHLRHFDFFTVNLNEEFSGLFGGVLLRQTRM